MTSTSSGPGSGPADDAADGSPEQQVLDAQMRRAQRSDPPMDDAEEAAWRLIGDTELGPTKVLERLNAQHQFVIGNVTLVGSLLTGLGGVVATVSLDRTTLYLGDVAVVPVGALVTSALAAAAVVTALFARRARPTQVVRSNPYAVRRYFRDEVAFRARWVKASSAVFIAAAVAAALTSFGAGLVTILDPDRAPHEDPVTMASLSATVGAVGAVTVALGGSVGYLDEDEYLAVVATSGDRRIVTAHVYPDADGTAALDLSAVAPVASSSATAEVSVCSDGAQVLGPVSFVASFPPVPAPVIPTTVAPEPSEPVEVEACATS